MRLLHTSDWHLGRSFHGASLLDEQAAAVDRMVELVTDGGIELVVIAGDLYDRAIPPADAIACFDDALARFHAAGATIVAIAGNHDSHVRVAAYDPLLSRMGVTVRGDVARCAEPVVVEPRNGAGPVAVYPLPYLDPTLAGPLLTAGATADGADDADGEADHEAEAARHTSDASDTPGTSGTTPVADGPDGPTTTSDPVGGPRRRLRHDAVTRLATDRMRADLARRPGARSVVVAHTFVTGGLICASERELTVGNVETVGVDAFAGFDYVALGHLHQSQERAGARVAYSGTPLPYSFSEQHHTKSVRIVDLGPTGAVDVEAVPLGVGRPLRTIEGPLDDLLTHPRHADAEAARVCVVLTDAVLPLQAMARIRQRFPHAAELHHRPPGGDADTAGGSARPADPTVTPHDLITRFWAHQHGGDPSAAEAALLDAALSAALAGATGNGGR